MGTFDVNYCTEADLRSVYPDISEYDRKREIHNWILHTGSIYKSGAVGTVSMLYKDKFELGAAEVSIVACTADGEWFYDSDDDAVYVYADDDPNGEDYEAGTDWATLVTDVIARASELTRSIVGKQIIKHRWGTRDYDEVIVSGTAGIACGRLIRPYNEDLANSIERYYNYDGDEFAKGMLQDVRDSKISLHNEITPNLSVGEIAESSIDASNTGGIEDTRGVATGNDIIEVSIVTGGTFAFGSDSTVTYQVKTKGELGLMTETTISATEINGDYQSMAYGVELRFYPGVYVANDSYYIELSKEPVETHQPFGSLRLTNL